MSFENKENTMLITKLPDTLLLKIISLLPLQQRLLVAEICQRLNRLSRLHLAGLTQIDLRAIDHRLLASLIRLCPRLRLLFAFGLSEEETNVAALQKAFHLVAERSNIALQLYNVESWKFGAIECFLSDMCRTGIGSDHPGTEINWAFPFEFVWHHDIPSYWVRCGDIIIPPSNNVLRLQLSGASYDVDWPVLADAMKELRRLESFILAGNLDFECDGETERLKTQDVVASLTNLGQLREACFAFYGLPTKFSLAGCIASAAREGLSQLETIWFGSGTVIDTNGLTKLAEVPSLKHVVFAGCKFSTVERNVLLPAREETGLLTIYNTIATQNFPKPRLACSAENPVCIPINDLLSFLNGSSNISLCSSWIASRILADAKRYGIQHCNWTSA